MTETRRVPLSTGVTLNVATAGPDDGPPVIFLHGFPESHRTWREIAPRLEDRFRLVMPDNRGFAGSDKPQQVEDYAIDTLVADVFALAGALGIDRFALVGHDWGGAVAWATAIRGNPRITRLGIVNSPHPAIFQKSLIDDPDQRAASQYMNAFRTPGFEKAIERMGYANFFDKSFTGHIDLDRIPPEERQKYIDDWSQPGAMPAMLNWYRSSPMVVPPPDAEMPLPERFLRSFPKIRIPTLVVWGMRDKALLPVQLDGLDELIDDVTIVRIPDAGHFVPWEKPDPVADALRPFLAAP